MNSIIFEVDFYGPSKYGGKHRQETVLKVPPVEESCPRHARGKGCFDVAEPFTLWPIVCICLERECAAT